MTHIFATHSHISIPIMSVSIHEILATWSMTVATMECAIWGLDSVCVCVCV